MDFGQRRLPFFSRSVRKHLRLKQQKLALKDQIARMEDELTPDIIA